MGKEVGMHLMLMIQLVSEQRGHGPQLFCAKGKKEVRTDEENDFERQGVP